MYSLGFYINFLVESDSLMNLQLVGLAKFSLNVYQKRKLTHRAEQLYEQVHPFIVNMGTIPSVANLL